MPGSTHSKNGPFEEKVECPQTTTDQGGQGSPRQKGLEGELGPSLNLGRAGEAAQWGTGRQVSAPYKEELATELLREGTGGPESD